ncbi:MAG: ABC transporter ATP-binding protein [Sphaerochaetaceae bacterium]|nr:ABC transporter ATP-binding protein [Sphaerochaetaceae bacterium]MDC7246772.1 ABC transporter ATP-binding protein [Sphaerochaetaceae bacterium]
MSLILSYIRKSWSNVLLIILLLAIKVVCDLSLPYYTSTIVNIGIQQGGINNVTPLYITASGYDDLYSLATEEQQTIFSGSYSFDGEKYYTTEENLNELEPLFLSYFSVPDLPDDNLKSQSAIEGIKEEYTETGVDLVAFQQQYILNQGIQMVGISLLSALSSILVAFFAARVAASTGKDLRNRVFSKVLTFHQNELDHFSTASLITRSTNDVQQIQQSLVMILRILFFAPLMAIGGVIRVVTTNNSMAWIIALASATILAVVITMFRLVMPKFTLLQKLVDKVNNIVRETLKGLSVIRSFGNQSFEKQRFKKANDELTRTSLFVNRSMSAMMPIMMLIMNLTSILIVWQGGIHISNGEMQVGDMMAFIQYSMIIIMSFLMITMLSIVIPRSAVSARRIDEVLRTDAGIVDGRMKKTLPPSNSRTVRFNHVSFTYPKADAPAISDISFESKGGTTTAIIGSTGSGKSTILQMIPRFIDASEGSIEIDGVDIRSLTLHDLRSNIGYVSQNGNLFKGTIESNITFGERNITAEMAREAAQTAQAEQFIEEKDGGYQSQVAQGGVNVSGGQRQRLSIARAIADRRPILLFDDSFSALDFKTESTVRSELKKKFADSTIIIVGQRISSIMHSDNIIVLDEGKMVGQGTHKELMKSCGVYQQIAKSQLSPQELKAYE